MLGVDCECVEVLVDLEAVDREGFDLGLAEHPDG